MFTKKFGDQLYGARAERHLSQEKMAELCGVSPRHYNDLENGKVNPHLDLAIRLSSLLDISIDNLRQFTDGEDE